MVFLRVAFLRVAGRLRAAVFFRAVVFLRAVDFLAVRFFVAFLAPEDAFLAGLTMPPFVNAVLFRAAPAYEGTITFDDAFRAGAAGLQSLRSCSEILRMKNPLRT